MNTARTFISAHAPGMVVVAVIAVALVASALYGNAVRAEAGRMLVSRVLAEVDETLVAMDAAETFPEFMTRSQEFENSVMLYLGSDVAGRHPDVTAAVSEALDDIRAAHESWAAEAEKQEGAERPETTASLLRAAAEQLSAARRAAGAGSN